MSFLNKLFGLKRQAKTPDVKEKFTEIHDKNLFHGVESISGTGSSMEQTAEIRIQLPQIVREFEINSMMDAPCGDYFWMRTVDFGDTEYIGLDIVQSLIDKNNANHADDKHRFLCLNIIEDELPKVDLIFCRDCLVHLTYDQAIAAIQNFKRSGARYLLTTTFPGRKNKDLGDIIWRPLDLQQPPFSLPEPIRLINEKCTEDNLRYTDKSLGLWDLNSISL